ncbi:MAG: DUF861 domain-containing protein [Gammaproteobacteria bacterium]|nr:DUF861 domain-containing protein [Gammaproteobacteria bacterium]
MPDLTVLKFEPHGPSDTGMAEWESMPRDELVSEVPLQRGHEYLNIPVDDAGSGTLTAGVWNCTPFETKLAPYGVNEFMHILEGSVSIVDQDGNSEIFSAGENFVIPKGCVCSWKQTEYLRKFYVIFDDTTTKAEDLDPVSPIRVDLSLALPEVPQQDSSLFIGGVPTMHQLGVFSDLTARFGVGLWDCTAMQRIPAPINRSELMYILEGSGSIINGDGKVFEFSAGDAFMVPVGMGYQWKSEGFVKKVYCSLT